MAKNGYTTLNLPTALVEELKVWKMAFECSRGRSVSYAEMIRGMLDCLKNTDPGVVDELVRMVENHPELQGKLSIYTSDSRLEGTGVA